MQYSVLYLYVQLVLKFGSRGAFSADEGVQDHLGCLFPHLVREIERSSDRLWHVWLVTDCALLILVHVREQPMNPCNY